MQEIINAMYNVDVEIHAVEKTIAPALNTIENLKVMKKKYRQEAERLINEDEHYKPIIKKLEDAGYTFLCYDFENSDDYFEVVEDDGTLHISYGKVRGCFICNQEISRKEWKAEAREVFAKLNLPLKLLVGLPH